MRGLSYTSAIPFTDKIKRIFSNQLEAVPVSDKNACRNNIFGVSPTNAVCQYFTHNEIALKAMGNRPSSPKVAVVLEYLEV